MKMWKLILPVTTVLLLAGQAVAQTEKEDRAEMEARKAEYAERLREAEERMEQAAREIAELASERLPDIAVIERRYEYANKPRIGITIGAKEESGAVEGIEIGAVTPESPADGAGLRAGDVITSVNDESLSAESSMAANKRLLEFMEGVEEGDVLELEYLRNGNTGTVELQPRVIEMHAFSWVPDVQSEIAAHVPNAPDFVKEFKFQGSFPFMGGVWSSMELVELNEGLGRYFGTDTGLLVVSSPKSASLALQDGDVIQTIDGREPTDVRHAMRILNSYQVGETMKLGIMRDRKQQTLDVEIPANQQGSLFAPPAVRPVRAPVPPRPVLDTAST